MVKGLLTIKYRKLFVTILYKHTVSFGRTTSPYTIHEILINTIGVPALVMGGGGSPTPIAALDQWIWSNYNYVQNDNHLIIISEAHNY